jgi:hypothetical protein
MLYPLSILSLILLALIHLTHGYDNQHQPQQSLSDDGVPFEIRAYWMRKANSALAEIYSPCQFAAFGSVIVNHTDLSEGPYGKVVCYSVNQNAQTGNPTLHGKSKFNFGLSENGG